MLAFIDLVEGGDGGVRILWTFPAIF